MSDIDTSVETDELPDSNVTSQPNEEAEASDEQGETAVTATENEASEEGGDSGVSSEEVQSADSELEIEGGVEEDGDSPEPEDSLELGDNSLELGDNSPELNDSPASDDKLEQAEKTSEPKDANSDSNGDVSESTSASDSTDENEGKEANPSQSEMPFAIVQGKEYTQLPKDLYIPPDALEVILEAFEGPLDLLLYLIRRQNLDILDIDVSEITHQYVTYVEMMDAMHFELAAEYLVMAAMLAEIKSRMLLPRSNEEEEEEEEDPRAVLIRRLQEYERFKQAAEDIDELPRMHRDIHVAKAQEPGKNITRQEPDIELKELLLALSEVLRRADMFESHHVEKEKLSTRERMAQVLDNLAGKQFVPFVSLFTVTEGRLGVVVTFLAVMELIKESLVEIVQTEAFGPIHVKARST